MEHQLLDTTWLLISAAFVFLMQAGFICLESGLTRAKNSINVAVKNLADFTISVVLFWIVGFALLFGESLDGWMGLSGWAHPLSSSDPWYTAFFLFQVMFCATAATIVSGAVAERMRFKGYVLITILISGLIYPIFGHWSWNGAAEGVRIGWLGAKGFVDFAGSTVVHSVGGWIALAALILVGPRTGRFQEHGVIRKITGSNLPVSVLGIVLLWFGWFGFNGGSTFSLNEQVPGIIVNTLLAGAGGGVVTLTLGWTFRKRPDVEFLMNGSLAGLVSITASCHAVEPPAAIIIGGIGGFFMYMVELLLLRFKIDDAISAVPVHLGAGIWGTIAVAFFGRLDVLGTGLDRMSQLWVQLQGIAVCHAWAFGVGLFILYILNRLTPLRVSQEDEHIGLNVSEHGASTELLDLLRSMDQQSVTGDSNMRVAVEPFTEVGQIAERYNQVMEAFQKAVSRTEAVFRDIRDGIFTFTKEGLLTSFNPGAEVIFGYGSNELIGKRASLLFETGECEPQLKDQILLEHFVSIEHESKSQLAVGLKKDQSTFPMELTVSKGNVGEEVVYTGLVRDVTEQQFAEKQANKYLRELERERLNLRGAQKELSGRVRELEHARRATLNLLQDHDESRKQTEEAEAQNRLILETSLDAIIAMDSGGRITSWNPQAEHIFGWGAQEAINQKVSELIIPLVFRSSHELGVKKFLESGESTVLNKRIEITALHRKGHEFPIELSISPVKIGDSYMFSAYVRDISERVKAEEALKKAKEEAEAASLAKSDFLANMSHEIRTPMNGIIGMTELLIDSPLDEEQLEYAHTVRGSADSLLTIINDILDFSKIEARQIHIEDIPFDLEVVLNEMIDLLATRIGSKDIELIFRFSPSTPARLRGDPGRIRQVLMNLASNAIKFTHKGHVLISVETEKHDDQQVHLAFSVKDTGIGIPENRIATMFEKFTQADTSTTRKYGGTGLGLSISKQLAELMGGTISVSSGEGEGSTFTLRLPLLLDLSPRPPMLPKADLKDVRILVVDDNETNRQVMDEMLNHWAIRHHVVASGKEALTELKQAVECSDPFHIALIDFQMPEMDGEELGMAIKEDPSLAKTAMVMLTSLGNRGEVSRLEHVGFLVYLNKPVRQVHVLDALATLWSAIKSGERLGLLTKHSLEQTRAQIHSVSEVLHAKHNIRGARILLVEDNLVNQKVANRMLRKLGCMVEVAVNGREAVEESFIHEYDIIFMDCQMPEMNGYEATTAIREREETSQSKPIVIIAMTANAMKGDRERCLEVGMDDYISKPIRQAELERILSKYYQADKRRTEVAERKRYDKDDLHSQGHDSNGNNQLFDVDSTLEALDGDRELLLEIIEVFLTDLPELLNNLESAIHEKEPKAIRDAAHVLKGAIGNFGINSAYMTAQELEFMGLEGNLERASETYVKFKKEFDKLQKALEDYLNV